MSEEEIDQQEAEEIVEVEALDPEDWSQFEEQAVQAQGENPVADEELQVTTGDEKPEVVEASEEEAVDFSAEGTELEAYESAEVEEAEFIDDDQLVSIVESILFTTDRPMSMAHIKQAFKGTKIKAKQIRRALDLLAVEYAGAQRGVTLEEVTGGYQLRTKMDNMKYLRRMVKARPFRLSGPALEVIAIAAYKQPLTKSEIDSIRGVESGHLLRGLMEKGLVNFAGKSDLPGKPMLYATTRKFLEIFGLRNIRELPSLTEIDELIPEGIGEVEEKKEKLEDITGDLTRQGGDSYSEGEEELMKISSQLQDITTSSDFFEEEKRRVKEKRDRERAQDIRDAQTMGEEVDSKDAKWLARYDKAQAEAAEKAQQQEMATEEAASQGEQAVPPTTEQEVEQAFDGMIKEEFTDESTEEMSVVALEEGAEEIEIVEGFEPVNEEASLEIEPIQTSSDEDLVMEENDDTLSSGVKIGEVSFGKLEEDLKIFNEDSMTPEIDPEPTSEA